MIDRLILVNPIQSYEQVTADRDYYRLCLQEATGSSKEKDKEAPTAIAGEEEQEAAAAREGEGDLAGQRGPFTDHLRPYLQEIRGLQRRVRDLEQQAQHAQHAAQQTARRRSSASALLLSSLLAATEGGGSPCGGGGVPPPSVLLQMTAAEPSSASAAEGAAAQPETELEKDLRLATEAEAGAFYRAHQEMSATVADLTRGIELKERLAAQLCESIKRYEMMRRVYEEKLRAMEEETARFVRGWWRLCLCDVWIQSDSAFHNVTGTSRTARSSCTSWSSWKSAWRGAPGRSMPSTASSRRRCCARSRRRRPSSRFVLSLFVRFGTLDLWAYMYVCALGSRQAATKKGVELGRLARQAQKTENQLKQVSFVRYSSKLIGPRVCMWVLT